MGFSLACDVGKTTLRIEGIDSDVTFNDVANAGAGSVAVDEGGTEDPSFFVTEHIANSMYRILRNVQFGDGSNALTFYSKNEMVYFNDNYFPTIKGDPIFNTILQLGEIAGDYCIKGASWSWEQSGEVIAQVAEGAIFRVYGSKIEFRGAGAMRFNDGSVDWRNSIFSHVDRTGDIAITSVVDGVILKDLYFSNWDDFSIAKIPDICEGVWMHYGNYPFACNAPAITLLEPKITDENYQVQVSGNNQTVTLKNPRFTPLKAKLKILQATGKIISQFTCDIHVVDKDGNNLESVTVTCEDNNSDQVFSVQTGADGKIAQQTIDYKKWEGPFKDETEYSPHRFTLSKAGQRTIVKDGITVDDKIDWTITMAGAGRALVGGS